MMNNGITALENPTWQSIRELKMTGWLWLSMAEGGLSRGDELPVIPPSQLSHVWGWSETHLVRIRADHALENGFVGALVERSAVVSQQENEPVKLWPADSGKIARKFKGFHDDHAQPNIQLREYTYYLMQEDQQSESRKTQRVPLTFYCA